MLTYPALSAKLLTGKRVLMTGITGQVGASIASILAKDNEIGVPASNHDTIMPGSPPLPSLPYDQFRRGMVTGTLWMRDMVRATASPANFVVP